MNYCSYVYITTYSGNVKTEIAKDTRRLSASPEEEIKNIKYFGSQPWPYPCGLMIGFTADYQEGEISLQQSELTSGSWFDAANLPTIPEKLSIARMLIDDWLKKQKNKN